MSNKLFGMFALLLVAQTGLAQRSSFYKFEVGGGLGMSNYLGEIGGKEKTERPFVWDMKLNQTRWAVGGYARYKMSNYLSVRADLIYGRIQGADSLSDNRGRVGRNLSFRNDLLEFSGRAEVYMYNTNDVGGKGWYRVDFKSYVFAGIGGVLHGPKALHNGEWVKLRPLTTEGVNYGRVTATMPIGVGFFFTYKRRHRFGWEMGWRMTFTDYLDDISGVYADPSMLPNATSIALANRSDELTDAQRPHIANYAPGQKRGDSNDNDTYFFTTFTYGYVFRGKNPFYTQHYSWLGGRKGRRTISRVKF
ncbi:MAG TPA: DUF6089 family protein [Flavobacteriales bacterium]|nr:DUF6089 family protein [Flavobacteriales bacterium]